MEDAKTTLEFPRDVAKEIAQYVNCGIKKVERVFKVEMIDPSLGIIFYMDIPITEEIVYEDEVSTHCDYTNLAICSDILTSLTKENIKEGNLDLKTIELSDNKLYLYNNELKHVSYGLYEGKYVELFKELLMILIEWGR